MPISYHDVLMDHALGKYLFSNKNLLFAFALSISLMLLLIYVPVFNLYFHTSSLMPVDWLFPLTAGVSLSYNL